MISQKQVMSTLFIPNLQDSPNKFNGKIHIILKNKNESSGKNAVNRVFEKC